MERFAAFQPHRSFCGNTSHCLGQSCLLFSIIKKRSYIHGKTYAVLLKTEITMKANLSTFTVLKRIIHISDITYVDIQAACETLQPATLCVILNQFTIKFQI